jgi:hypothetical protein
LGFQSKIRSVRKNIHSDHADYLNALDYYIESSKTATDFIGHCCYIRNQFDAQRYPDVPNVLPDPASLNGINIAGNVCYPQYGLIMPVNFECMDVIGLGAEKSSLAATWHFVVDELQAFDLQRRNIYPRSISSSNLPDTFQHVQNRNVKISAPHELDGKTKKVRVFSLLL